jgi:UDP-N-acetyl-D-mannosaminuronic acid transferase (WecB/TagA/CpsF family)
MNEFIAQLAEKLSLPESTVRSGVGVLLKLLREKTSGTEFAGFLARIPGGAELAGQVPEAAAAASSGLGGLLGMLGGQAADLAKASAALQQAGVPADKILPLASGFFEKAQEVAGPEVMEELSRSFPILKTLLKR